MMLFRFKNGYIVRLFGVKLFSYYHSPGFFWAKVGRYGFVLKDTKKCKLSFSERNTKQIIIGKWLIGR